MQNLLKPENKAPLTKILTYHVVAGNISSHDLLNLIKKGHCKAELKAVEGGALTAILKDGKVMLTDARRYVATVAIADVYQSNAVIRVINTALLPN